jgi:hypothetical protein
VAILFALVLKSISRLGVIQKIRYPFFFLKTFWKVANFPKGVGILFFEKRLISNFNELLNKVYLGVGT